MSDDSYTPITPKGDPMNENWTDAAFTHGMLGGSHERPGGPECRCGADWDWFNDLCTRETLVVKDIP